MADFNAIMESQKSVKIVLDKEMTLEELYETMNNKASEFSTSFKYNKGLFGLGKCIKFNKDKETDLIITVSVKGNVITVKPIIQENTTSVGIGGVETRVDKNSVLRKGVSGVMDIPVQRGKYRDAIADTIRVIVTQ